MKLRKDPKDLKCALVHLFATKLGLQRKGYYSVLFDKIFTRKDYFNHDAIYSCGRLNNNVFKLKSSKVNEKEKLTEDDHFYYSESEGNPSWMTAEKLPLSEDGFLSYEESAKPFQHRKCVKPGKEVKGYDDMEESVKRFLCKLGFSERSLIFP